MMSCFVLNFMRERRAEEGMDPVTLLHQLWQEQNKTTLFNLLFLSILFLLFSLLYLLKLAKTTSKLNLPPSPPKLPIIGNLHQLGTLLHQSLRALSEKYGPLMVLYFGNSPVIVVSSADIAKEIMKTNDFALAGRPRTRAADVFFYGCSDIVFCPYGEYWRQAKKICVLELLSHKRVQSFQFVREEEVAKMVEKLRLSCLNGAAIDLSEMFVTISNNIISRSVTGRIYEGEDGKNLGQLSRRAMDIIGALWFEELFPLLKWMDVIRGLPANLKRTSKALDAILEQVIEEHKVKKKSEDESDQRDFVDILLHLQNNDMFDINLTQENLKAILLDMFVAGTESTSVTMEWAMAELVKNPRIMKKAQEEVRRVVGEKSKVNETHINQMDYLKCIIKETLRLHTPSMIVRESCASTKLEGYNIPPNTRVFINPWAIQRDPKLWDKPEEYLPERFANNEVDFRGQHNQFIPFGFGRRGCPGISYAILQVEYVLANLLYWFDWELPDGASATKEDLDMSEMFTTTIRKKIPLCLVPSAHHS